MASNFGAEIEASRLRKELSIEDRRFDLLSLVRDTGIEVHLCQIPSGAEGLSLSLNGQDVILIDPSCGPESRQRFTLAHEFGHQMLGHSGACSGDMIHGRPTDPHEQEANHFATSLLMPAKLFRQDIQRIHPRFEEISPIAKDYGTSLTATTLRYTDLTDDYCALLCFRPSKHPWFVKSKRVDRWRIRLEAPPSSLVAAHLHGKEADPTSQTSARAWIENFERRADELIREEVRKVANQTWLVLLSELPDPEDDPDLEEREAEEEQKRRRMSFRRY